MAIVHGTGSGETINALDGVSNSADMIFGLAGDDRIYALGGNDEILGGLGADYIDGGAGIDTASYAGSSTGVGVVLKDGKGTYGEARGDTLVSIENATGSAHNDQLRGSDDNNVLRGMAGDDLLVGLGGADIVIGGYGFDVMTGGLGGDTFRWTYTEETDVEALRADHITDFSFAEGDRIDLAAIDADVYAAGNQAFTFIGNAPFSGTPGEINYIHANGYTLIQLQTGTSPDVEAVIGFSSGIVTPEASWFVL